MLISALVIIADLPPRTRGRAPGATSSDFVLVLSARPSRKTPGLKLEGGDRGGEGRVKESQNYRDYVRKGSVRIFPSLVDLIFFLKFFHLFRARDSKAARPAPGIRPAPGFRSFSRCFFPDGLSSRIVIYRYRPPEIYHIAEGRGRDFYEKSRHVHG